MSLPSPPPTSPLQPSVSQVLEQGRMVRLPPEITRVAQCTLIHNLMGYTSLRVVSLKEIYDGSSERDRDNATASSSTPSASQHHALVMDVLAQELSTPSASSPHSPTSPTTVSHLNSISDALLSPQWASSLYSISTYGNESVDHTRCVLGRLIISWTRHFAIFIAHDVAKSLVDLGPYPLEGVHLPDIHWPQSYGNWPAGTLDASCALVDRYRRNELARQLGTTPLTHSTAHPPQLVFPPSSFTAIRQDHTLPFSHDRFAFLTVAHIENQTEARGHFLPQPSFLHAREDGYLFPFEESPRTRHMYVPASDEGCLQALVPPEGVPFHLCVRWTPENVEYMGIYQRVPSAHVWPWHRMTKHEWEHFSSASPETQLLADAVIARTSRAAGTPARDARAAFECGERCLGALFLRCVGYDARVVQALRRGFS
ncbi:hypothetical protein DENSPDRAFT_884841 [Dentipellis sp. KUC8613]|nr:hypothetical protein DENSPDRAFT_884841 [Dentipellis sp. KUC8613]